MKSSNEYIALITIYLLLTQNSIIIINCLNEINLTIEEEIKIGTEIYNLNSKALEKRLYKDSSYYKNKFINNNNNNYYESAADLVLNTDAYNNEENENDENDDLNIASENIINVSFAFLDGSKLSNEYFALNGSLLTIAKRIDRDTLCENKQIKSCVCHATCLLKLDILASGVQAINTGTGDDYQNNFDHILTVYVHVLDINDNKPRFPRTDLFIELPENVPYDHRVPIQVAYDADYGRNSINRYLLREKSSGPLTLPQLVNSSDLENENKLFTIDYSNLKSIYLKVIGQLDRETNSTYMYNLYAIDGGQPPFFGVASLTIKVLDQNDNSPRFLQEYYRLNISETTPVGTKLLKINAYDPDEGLNGQIEYQLVYNDYQLRNNGGKLINRHKVTKSDRTSQESGRDDEETHFSIDAKTGELYLQEKLDYEKQKSYKLTITASDKGTPSTFSSNQCVIEIFVYDENDNPPEIRIVTAEQHQQPTDMKSPLFFNSLQNLEKQANRHLGKEENQIQTLYVQESAPNGTFLCLVTIKDADSGENSRFEWSLKVKPNDGAIRELLLFKNRNDVSSSGETNEAKATAALNAELNENLVNLNGKNKQNLQILTNLGKTFALVTAKSLDREIQSEYQVEISARDFGKPKRLESTLLLKVIVTDVNDNKPIFKATATNKNHPFYEFRINENNPINAIVGCVSAVDFDEPDNAKIHYDITGESNDGTNVKTLVSINQSTGCLHALVSFDREVQGIYEFQVIAIDSGQPSLNSSALIRLIINDVNDHVPYFSQAKYNFSVEEHSKIGTEVGQIVAFDLDENENSQLEFSLNALDKRHKNYFQIDAKTGLITVKSDNIDADLRAEDDLQLHYMVYVHDKGVPSFATNCKLTINILDINDNCPEIYVNTKSNNFLQYALTHDKQRNLSNIAVAVFYINRHLLYRLKRQEDVDQLLITNFGFKDIDRDKVNNKVYIKNQMLQSFKFKSEEFQINLKNELYFSGESTSYFTLTDDGYLYLNLLKKQQEVTDDENSMYRLPPPGIYKIYFDLTDSAIKPCVVQNKYLLLIVSNNDTQKNDLLDYTSHFIHERLVLTNIMSGSMSGSRYKNEYINDDPINSNNGELTNQQIQLQKGRFFSISNTLIVIIGLIILCVVVFLMFILCVFCVCKYNNNNNNNGKKATNFEYKNSVASTNAATTKTSINQNTINNNSYKKETVIHRNGDVSLLSAAGKEMDNQDNLDLNCYFNNSDDDKAHMIVANHNRPATTTAANGRVPPQAPQNGSYLNALKSSEMTQYKQLTNLIVESKKEKIVKTRLNGSTESTCSSNVSTPITTSTITSQKNRSVLV